MPRWLKRTIGVLGILVAIAAIELAMGRVPWCTCHHLRPWVGSTKSPELSQQIADWYSFSHIIHGFAFYAIARWVGRRWSLSSRFVLATLIEAAWEVLENSPIIIDRYRHTAAQGYTGDSVVNSISDIGFGMVGFALAARLPLWVILCLIVVMEVGVGVAIRDNLTLNVIMLLHPFEGIRRWQMGA